MLPVYSATIGARAVVAAARFVGLTEIRSNAKWDNLDTAGFDAVAEELKHELLKVGWQSGWPYCAAFCEAVWRKAYQGLSDSLLVRDMLTPGCLQSWRNALEARWTSQVPQIGSIGIMRKGDTGFGHAFLVRRVGADNTLYTIEANTSPQVGSASSDREGDGVYCKTRKLVFKPTSGLYLLGFILPCTT